MNQVSVKNYPSDDIYYFNAHRKPGLVLALQQRYETFEAQKDRVIPEIFKKHGYIIKEIGVNQNTFGTGHVIYFVTTADDHKYVYRGNIDLEEPEHYMSLERQFIDLARHAGWPVGDLIAADSSRSEYDFDYQIFELLP